VYKIFSVDDHIVEPADVWSSRVPSRYRDTAPHVVEEDGREYWEYENTRILTMGLNAVAGKPREAWGMEPARFADMIPGCYDSSERAKDLLTQGVLASVSFPTLPRFGGMLFNTFEDKDLAYECVKAWNDFVLDEWCPGGPPGLFVPMVITTTWDPVTGEKEIRRCVDRGAKALCFVENPVPDGLPSFHHPDHWDPIWRICEEAGLPVCMHIGSSGYMPVIDPSAPFSAIISGATAAGMLAMVNMLLSGVCERFPAIKMVWSEGGIGWVPSTLERCDRQIERHQYWAGKPEGLTPSEIFRRNMWACMVEEPQGLKLYDWIGEDKILAETDYPHADTPFPHTQKAYADLFEGIPAEVVDKVSYLNASKLFDWQIADPSLATPDAQWSPPADYRPKFAIAHSSGTRAPGDPTVCQVMVTKGNLTMPCGAAIGDEGRCEAGH
jgi:predicted TIM-barrel fold metal-dependent hydrolase